MAKLELVDVDASALLARFTASTGSKSQFIFGRDGDGQPFMTQVTLKPRTVEEAFGYLTPKIVEEAIAQGLDVKRQGDWFFIPTQEPAFNHSYVPTFHFNLEGQYMTSKIRQGTLYHSQHFQETRHATRGEIIYRAVGRHFVRDTVTCPDHPPLLLGGQWHLAVRRNSHNWENARQRPQGDKD